MFIKICGIQTPKAALVAADAGADFIGLVFAKSKRQITTEQAEAIKAVLSETSVKIVGVFRNQPLEEVNRISQLLELDYVQLHGDESLEECRTLKTPFIKALSYEKVSEAESFQEVADYVLIDSPRPGSGKSFDWSRWVEQEKAFPYFLAGGLSLENIEAAVKQVQPVGVDVSSGVETNGQKDEEKIRRFIQLVRQKK